MYRSGSTCLRLSDAPLGSLNLTSMLVPEAGNRSRTCVNTKLGKNVLEVTPNGSRRQVQLRCHLGIGSAHGDELEDL